MKNIKRKLSKYLAVFILNLLIFTSLSLPMKLNAASPSISEGPYTGYSISVMNADGIHSQWSANYQAILIGGEYGFCVQPGYILSTGSDFNPNNYDDAAKLSIIAYEGWIRSNHTMEDYLATQFMIWEELGGQINSTSFSAYASYKTTIENRIRHHYDVPSFDSEDIILNAGESKTITDTNGVFEQYTLTNNGGLNISKSGNSLTLTATDSSPDNTTIVYQKIPNNCVGTSIVYKKPGSQEAARLYVSDPLKTNIKVKVNKYGSLHIAKQDDLGNYVPNTTFILSKHEDMSEPIGTYTTSADGTITIEQLLLGTYYVQEIAVPSHLILDTNIKCIEIKPDKTSYFTAENKWKRGNVRVVKTDIEGNAIDGAKLEIYDSKGDVIEQWTSDKQPHVVSGLLVGESYTLHEAEAPIGYKLSEDILFTVKEDNEIIVLTMQDDYVMYDFKMNKIDKETKNAIVNKDFIFNIYKDQECSLLYKNVDANMKEGALRFQLHFGDWWIKEVSSPSGYQQSNKVKHIQINREGVFVDGIKIEGQGTLYVFDFENEKIKNPIVKTGEQGTTILYLFALMGVSMGTMYCLKRMKKDMLI